MSFREDGKIDMKDKTILFLGHLAIVIPAEETERAVDLVTQLIDRIQRECSSSTTNDGDDDDDDDGRVFDSNTPRRFSLELRDFNRKRKNQLFDTNTGKIMQSQGTQTTPQQLLGVTEDGASDKGKAKSSETCPTSTVDFALLKDLKEAVKQNPFDLTDIVEQFQSLLMDENASLEPALLECRKRYPDYIMDLFNRCKIRPLERLRRSCGESREGGVGAGGSTTTGERELHFHEGNVHRINAYKYVSNHLVINRSSSISL